MVRVYLTGKKHGRQQSLQQPGGSPLRFRSAISTKGLEKTPRQDAQLHRSIVRACCYITQQHSMAAPVETLKHEMLQIMPHIYRTIACYHA